MAWTKERKAVEHRKYYLKNRKHLLEKAKQYRENNKEKLLDYFSHPDVLKRQRELTRERRRLDPDKDRKRRLNYYKNNKDKVLFWMKRRVAIRQKSEGSHTYEEWVALRDSMNGICPCCKQKRKLTEDHIIPLNKGGSNFISNIQPLCQSCNSSKQDRHSTKYI